MDRLLEATYRAEQQHFWFRGFTRFVTPLITKAVDGVARPEILDCGCGTGANAEHLAPFVREVVCIDQSAPMLDAARERLRDLPNVRFEQGPLEALPLLNKIGTNVGRLNALTAEIIRVEEKSDELFDQGMKALFKTYGETSPMKFIVGAEIYDHLEKVVDRFEDVANRISGIVIEHM